MNLRRHILLFHQAALGDFIMTWPLAMALGRVFAQSRVAYVTGFDKGRLAEETIGIESLNADAGWHTLFGQAPIPEGPVRKRLEQTQFAVLFAQNPEPQFVSQLRGVAGDIPVLVLQPNPPPGTHVWDHQLAQLPPGQPLQTYVQQMQRLISERGVGVRTGRPRSVVIHPGSGSPRKNWQLGKFVDVATRLKVAGHDVAFVLGDVERERFTISDVKSLEVAASTHVLSDLPTLRRHLLDAETYIGNDTGPTHLAAVLGLNSIALYGPHSDRVVWHPRGPHVRLFDFDTPAETIAFAAADR